MTWGNPLAIWLFLGLGLIVLCLWGYGYWLKRQHQRFVSADMNVRVNTHHVWRHRMRMGLWVGALACFIVALMQPRYGYVFEKADTSVGAVVLAVDVSLSMAAEDVRPSRFDLAKQQLLAILDALEGQYVGLVVFAGEAYLQCPLTTDYVALRSYIQELRPGFLPVQGTNLEETLRIVSETRNVLGSPFDVFLFSDGESLSGDSTALLGTLRRQGVRVYPIGIGLPSGEPIPLRNSEGKITDHKRDKEGKVVLSALDAQALTQIAKATGGRYISGSEGRVLEEVVTILDTEKSRISKAANIRHYHEWFMIPLSLGLCMLAFQWALSDKRGLWIFGKLTRHVLKKRKKGLGCILGICLIGMFASPILAALPQDILHYSQGKKAYAAGNYPKAAQAFSQVSSDTNPGHHYYNLGNAAYQTDRLEEAEAYYQTAMPYMKSAQEKAWLNYNLGNTAFRQGKFHEAAALYRKSLIYDSHDRETKINLELVLKKIKEQESPPPPRQNPDNSRQNPQEQDPQDDKHKREQQKKEDRAKQTLKTLQQKEQFNTMPPMTDQVSPEKDW